MFVSYDIYYDFYPDEPYDRSLDNFRLLTPGVLFSFFIIVVQRPNWTMGKLILLFFILLILYSVCLVASLYSWGLAVPFAGGIGALVIRKSFYQSAELFDTKGKDYFIGFYSRTCWLILLFRISACISRPLDKWSGIRFYSSNMAVCIWDFMAQGKCKNLRKSLTTVDMNGLRHSVFRMAWSAGYHRPFHHFGFRFMGQ